MLTDDPRCQSEKMTSLPPANMRHFNSLPPEPTVFSHSSSDDEVSSATWCTRRRLAFESVAILALEPAEVHFRWKSVILSATFQARFPVGRAVIFAKPVMVPQNLHSLASCRSVYRRRPTLCTTLGRISLFWHVAFSAARQMSTHLSRLRSLTFNSSVQLTVCLYLWYPKRFDLESSNPHILRSKSMTYSAL